MKLEPVLLFGLCLVSLGCEDKIVTGLPRTGASASAQPAASASAARSAIPKLDLQDSDFAESDKSRDPFRSFARLFIEESAGQVESQVEVMLEKYSLDQLKLIGIITRVHPERAMLVDPNGVGHVVKRGQFIGKADVVQTAKNSGASYQVHWRVDRIRNNDVVFIREDPQNPDVPVARRVLPLRTEEEVAAEEALANSG